MEVSTNIRKKGDLERLYHEYRLKDNSLLKIGASPSKFFISKGDNEFITFDGTDLYLNGVLLKPENLSSFQTDYVMLTDGSANFRIGVRDSKFVVDKALTETGFNGTENSDWENLSESQ